MRAILMGLRESKKEETRRLVRAAARELFAEKGFDGTTMRELAARAGVGLGTIGLHFKDKDSLLLAAFHDEIGQVFDASMDAAASAGTFREQVAHVVEVLFHRYDETPYLQRVVRKALFAQGEWREKFDAQVAKNFERVAALVAEAQERGEVHPDADGVEIATVVWSLYLNVLIQALAAPEFQPQMRTEQVMQLFDTTQKGFAP